MQVKNKKAVWLKMKGIQDRLGIKNMSDLTIKAIKGKYETERLTQKQSREHKNFGK